MTATPIPLAFAEWDSMVQDWQVVAIAVSILIAVLTTYGAVIRRNYDVASTLKQRLLGADGDETDDGFIAETERRFDKLEGKVDRHSRQTHRQLYAVDKKVNLLVAAISESDVDGEIQTEGLDDVPDPAGRDFLRSGDGTGTEGEDREPQADGGQPIDADNPQENCHEDDET